MRGHEELDGQDVLHIREDRSHLPRRVRRHRHVVLGVRRGRDRVDRGGVGEDFVLRHERRRRVLRDHQPGVHAGARGEVLRQVAVVVAVEEHGRAALGDVGQLRERDREEVGGERDRLAVEVAGGVGEARVAAVRRRPVLAEAKIERLTLVGEEERVVGGGVDLALRDGARVFDGVPRRAVDLRSAAQGVRVLHGAGALDEVAALDELAHARGAADLAGMPAGLMHLRVERARAAAHRLEGQRGGVVADVGEALRVVDAEGQHRRGEVHAVDEGEAFLERRRDRLRVEAEELRKLAGVARRRIVRGAEAAFAEERREGVRERAEIAARADGALHGHERNHAAIQHRLDDVDHRPPHA